MIGRFHLSKNNFSKFIKVKNYIVFILMHVLTITASAGEWSLTDEGCKVWNKLPVADEKVRWEGKCLNGFVEGKGKLIWIDQNNQSETHEGIWLAGKLQGFAISNFPGGDRYSGGYVDGEREGWGVYVWRNGNKYIGRLKNGYFDGVGIRLNSAGFVIEEGLWAKGKLINKKKFGFKDF